MQRSESWRDRRYSWALARRLLASAGLGGGGAFIPGCFVSAGVATAVAVGVLIGLIISQMHVSFTVPGVPHPLIDDGDADLTFSAHAAAGPSLLSFSGRLPGFHMVIVSLNDKGRVAARGQEGEVVPFETEVDIDFEQDPPVISGRIRQVDGGQFFDLLDLYPEISEVSLEIGEADGGRYPITINIKARTADGEELDYTLALEAEVSAGGRLTGAVEVQRVLTPPDAAPIVIDGSGTIEGEQQPADIPIVNANQNQADDENDNQEADDQIDQDNQNTEPDDENDNQEPGDEPGDLGNDNEQEPGDSDNDNEQGDQEVDLIEADDCPSIPSVAIPVLNQIISAFGFEGFDIDQSGFVSAQEVQDVVNPSIEPFAITEEAAACAAAIING